MTNGLYSSMDNKRADQNNANARLRLSGTVFRRISYMCALLQSDGQSHDVFAAGESGGIWGPRAEETVPRLRPVYNLAAIYDLDALVNKSPEIGGC
jgi:hypothetical protein